MYHCPLCQSTDTRHYHSDKRRDYFQCFDCQLVFVDPKQRLAPAEEKAEYDLHENDASDIGYRKFLSRLVNPLANKLVANSHGLDFGCGPGPTLSLMLSDLGHTTALYDVYFYPDKGSLHNQYDYVTATEVIEHLYHPGAVWQQWLGLLKMGGWLGLMTKLVKDVEAFSKWHYKNDLTHVVFFSRETFEFLAKRDKLHLEFIGNDVILLRKTSNES
ncbi:methyltransferase domain-containing protein [Vibrio sp. S4M6]|uniref:methyltransferase domain-containing protein n=1 Tax=Vibrio sinus TaxID=2946865 RepID=UPI002029E194|nr:methyltransferase domain-containing protein [Vibrio sinus]MCL9782887.1 methyltransferase domain-containing protein [Vibrio sinus]